MPTHLSTSQASLSIAQTIFQLLRQKCLGVILDTFPSLNLRLANPVTSTIKTYSNFKYLLSSLLPSCWLPWIAAKEPPNWAYCFYLCSHTVSLNTAASDRSFSNMCQILLLLYSNPSTDAERKLSHHNDLQYLPRMGPAPLFWSLLLSLPSCFLCSCHTGFSLFCQHLRYTPYSIGSSLCLKCSS